MEYSATCGAGAEPSERPPNRSAGGSTLGAGAGAGAAAIRSERLKQLGGYVEGRGKTSGTHG